MVGNNKITLQDFNLLCYSMQWNWLKDHAMCNKFM